jgi:hypothetical protein
MVAQPPPATSHRPTNPATCHPRAAVTSRHPYLYSVTTSTKRSAISPIASNSLAPLLCSALHCRLPLYSPWIATTKPPPCCPTRPKGVPWRRAPPALSASWVTTYQSRAAEVSTSATTSVRSSSSTAAVRAPPASPPLQERPLEFIVWPRLHLHHRRPSIWAKVIVVILWPPSAFYRQPSPTVL